MNAFTRWGLVGSVCLPMVTGAAADVEARLAFAAHTGSVRKAIITPDGLSLITQAESCLRDRELIEDTGWKMWDLATGTERVMATGPCRALALSPDGTVLAVAEDRQIRLRELAGDRDIRALAESGGAVEVVAFSPDGRTLASARTKPGASPGSSVTVATLWNVETGAVERTLEPSPGPVRDLAFSPDGRLLAVATQEFPLIGGVTLWEVAAGKVRSTLEADGVDCLAFSPDGARLAAGCLANRRGGKKEGHHVRLWDVEIAKDLHSLKHEGRVYCVAFAPDGRTVASGSESAELKLWDAATGELKLALPTQTDIVRSITFSKDGATMVSTTRDGFVKCWETARLKAAMAVK